MLTMKNNTKTRRRYVPLLLSERILAQWGRPVASSEALDLLHRAMRAVMYQLIGMAIKTASKAGVLFYYYLFACCPGGRWGNTEQVVDQWQCPEASGIALEEAHLVYFHD